ncbi:MAG: nitroreductase [Dehalococcoidales bacterium]|nr:nitroreductase [Dehalococcoidales bacterium]
MDIVEAVKLRKSIRGYKPDPVPKAVLKDILEIATRAPSSVNTQPWEFTIIAGEVLNKIKQATIEKVTSGEPGKPTIRRAGYTGKYRERQIAIAVQLFQLMGIAREDKEKRNEWSKRGLRFFDAPTVIIISIDRALTEAAQFDVGAISQTIALVALNYGLGTCVEEVSYPDVISKFTNMPESKEIIISLPIGYPDWNFPANKVQSNREPVENLTTWHGM